MAIIDKFVADDRIPAPQRTTVECKYFVLSENGKASLLQLDTYGSSERETPGKQSQTIQLTRKSALDLWELLGKEFGFENSDT